MVKQLTVKGVLQYPQGLELGTSPDVRRFKVAQEPAGDLYSRLLDTLPAVFTDLADQTFTLYWKDNDGDLVQFSSQGEMQTSLDSMADNVFRIFIVVDDDDAGETTATDSEAETEKSTKRVRFQKAGRKWRRRLRRRRQAAMADDQAVSKEYRKGVRLLAKQLPSSRRGDTGPATEQGEQEKATLAALSPEVQSFVTNIFNDWHKLLATKRPRVVARRIRKKQTTLPADLEREHFRWLCRFLSRWHRRHAGKCDVMAGWSSGDTGADTSGDEETLLMRVKKDNSGGKKGEKTQEQTQAALAPEETETEDTEKESTVTKEFRKDVRVLMNRFHRKKAATKVKDDDKTTLNLTPEVQAFVTQLLQDWHIKLARKRPRVVARKIKGEQRDYPSGMDRDHFVYLCRFIARWHRRHAEKCDVMSAWSSTAETSGEETEEERKTKDGEKKKDGKKDKKEKKEKKDKSGAVESEGEEEDEASKQFRKDARVLVNRLHRKKKAAAKGGKPKATEEEEQTTVASMTPEVQAFVEQYVEEWHAMLTTKRPQIVAKKMKTMKGRELPSGMEKKQFKILARLLARWHHRHAGKCDVMSGWSSGEAEDDTSGEEDASAKRRRKQKKRGKKGGESDGGLASEDTDCLETACKPVSLDFRKDVRNAISQLHKKKKSGKEETTSTTLSPEVLKFLEQFSTEWHGRLSRKRPRAASNEMKAADQSLPSRMEREQYTWLCCFMARWHRKHADTCEAMAKWSQGESASEPDA